MSRRCPNRDCQFENSDDRDFCVKCRTYLRWELTESRPPVIIDPPKEQSEPAPAPVEPPARDRARRVLLAVRRPGDDRYATEPLRLPVEAGGQATVHLLIRNEDSVVDRYDVSVPELPDSSWVTINPETVYLLPFESGDGYEQEIEVIFHPPRKAEAEARPWPVRLVVESRTHKRTATSLPLTIEIAPFAALSAKIHPERKASRRRASYWLTVTNDGNSPHDVTLAGEDAEGTLHYVFDPLQPRPRMNAPARARVRVRPSRPMVLGRPRERSFTVITTVLPPITAEPVRTVAVLRQKAWIPRWMLWLIPLLLIAAILAVLFLWSRAEVPRLVDLRGQFHAEQALKAQGLELGKVTPRVVAGTAPGTVIGQAVAAGEHVRKGSSVGIEIAVGTGRAKVPDVRRLTLPAAEEALVAAGFQLGRVNPANIDAPDKARVSRQIPRAGERLRKGSPITLYVRVPGASDGPAKPAPAVAGLTAGAASAALEDAGFEVDQTTEISAEVARGDVIRQIPNQSERLAPGKTVRMVVSAGYPRIVYDDGQSLTIADGVNGAVLRRIAGSDAKRNSQAAWSPDASRLVFRRGNGERGRIMRVDLQGSGAPRAVTDSGFDDGRPAVSPDGKVVAFIRREVGKEGDDRLCFTSMRSPPGPARCVTGLAGGIGRPEWAPDGASLLALMGDEQAQVEVIRFVTERPNSARASTWSAGELVTDAAHGQRESDRVSGVAAAPAGEPRLALAANWGTGSPTRYAAFVGPLDDRGTLEDARALGTTPACSVAWRSDARELLVGERPECGGRQTGRVSVVDLKGELVRTVSVDGANPAWEPIRLQR